MNSYKKGGWEEKYIIQKANGKPTDEEAQYFVLRFDVDPHARIALKAYADSVLNDNPKFAMDIVKQLTNSLDEFNKNKD
ncbi:hypothetical protein KAR91_31700 [Candidatus Pacearchaeota archaeon]|nr:hypothetical protein [Candidatus Pacearchaeota archaeon]